MTVLGDTKLTGPEKLKALEVYREVTDRPWAIMRTLMTALMVLLGGTLWAISDRIRGK
jgi:hypothetical protein